MLAERARQATKALQAEYAAGKTGDPTEPEPIWGTPREQLDSLIMLLRRSRRDGTTADPIEADPDEAAAEAAEAAAATAAAEVAAETEAEAELATALRRVDWTRVRAATSERTGDAADAMRTMAQQVDWAKVQPVAAQLSSALIAAVASGQLGLGGRLGPTVARAIINQGGVAQRLATTMHADPATRPPDFRDAIEASARNA
jgi:hypothetical protein